MGRVNISTQSTTVSVVKNTSPSIRFFTSMMSFSFVMRKYSFFLKTDHRSEEFKKVGFKKSHRPSQTFLAFNKHIREDRGIASLACTQLVFFLAQSLQL